MTTLKNEVLTSTLRRASTNVCSRSEKPRKWVVSLKYLYTTTIYIYIYTLRRFDAPPHTKKNEGDEKDDKRGVLVEASKFLKITSKVGRIENGTRKGFLSSTFDRVEVSRSESRRADSDRDNRPRKSINIFYYLVFLAIGGSISGILWVFIYALTQFTQFTPVSEIYTMVLNIITTHTGAIT